MNLKFKRITAAAASLAVALSPNMSAGLKADAAYGAGGNGSAIMEYLDRGIYAIKSGNGMFVSWRFNANDDDNAEFQLFRDDQLIYTSKAGEATNYWDASGNSSSKYRVDTLVNGNLVSSEGCRFTSGANYFDIPLDVPRGGYLSGQNYTYSPNDCCVGDVDGDGQYEIFVKWDPSNAQDNSKAGPDYFTGNVYIDCYTLSGQKLWRIDMGKNIRAGQHYTQMAVADFDCDGKAELITKTCDGTVDGRGQVIGNGNANYVDSNGTVLQGPEYMTLFEGATGAALDTIDFPVPRGVATGNTARDTWGDNYGNRCERYNCAIAYLDGVHPSAIYGRGYYTRLSLSAVDVKNGKLVKKWVFDTGFDSSNPAYGNGNHNVMVADFDNDGRQEVCMGACVIDDNGRLLWSTGKGHGDAMHVGDLDPNHEGIEVFLCHESGNYGISLVDGRNGQIIWHFDGDKDTGRCCADNVLAGNSGAEFWGSRPAGAVYDVSGRQIGSKQPAMNFLIYWDGDLERELLDNIYITKMKSASDIQTIFTASGCASNNDTKAVPCLTADISGDWREELVLRTEDNSKLRIWCTNTETQYRITTLMHDMQYRMQCGCQQSSYNQPPHPSFYLGTEAQLPARPDVKLNNTPPEPINGKLVKNLLVKDYSNSGSWKLMESNTVGGAVYGDRDFTYTALANELQGCEYIMTACNSKNTDSDLAEFTTGGKTDVYVLVDTREEDANSVPSWLSGYTRTDLTAQTSNGVTFAAYKKSFDADQKVVLGTNGMTGNVINYTVFVKEQQEVTTTTTTTTVIPVTITNIPRYEIMEVISYPTKTTYTEGESLDLSGVSVKVRSVTHWESLNTAEAGTFYGEPFVAENITLDPEGARISNSNGNWWGTQANQLKAGTYTVAYSGQYSSDGRTIDFENFKYQITVKDPNALPENSLVITVKDILTEELINNATVKFRQEQDPQSSSPYGPEFEYYTGNGNPIIHDFTKYMASDYVEFSGFEVIADGYTFDINHGGMKYGHKYDPDSNTYTYELFLTKNKIVWGDANCDNTVDMADAVLIMQSISNPNRYGINGSESNRITEQGQLNGDVDDSSKGITSRDALRIQEYLLGKFTLD